MEIHYFFILLNYHDISLPSNIYVIISRSVMNPATARETLFLSGQQLIQKLTIIQIAKKQGDSENISQDQTERT